jgi:hypothetical protein
LYHEDNSEIMGLSDASDASVSDEQMANITEGIPYNEVNQCLDRMEQRLLKWPIPST